MSLTRAESSYYVYLTERMDKGESKNIVIPTTVDLISKHSQLKSVVKILDIGCFNGAMLNQIRLGTPAELRQRVSYTGAEIDGSLIEDGRKRYPELNFRKLNLQEQLPDLEQYDIVILSNVLHEVIPNSENIDVEKVIGASLKKISSLVTADGDLLILDGLRPDNDTNIVEVCFATSEVHELYKQFAEKYTAFKIYATDLGENIIQTRVKDLAAFLTKARYLFESYWSIESQQIYQYFNKQQFTKALQLSGFRIERLEPQRFDQEHVDRMFSSITPKIEYPAKNLLIVATKNN